MTVEIRTEKDPVRLGSRNPIGWLDPKDMLDASTESGFEFSLGIPPFI